MTATPQTLREQYRARKAELLHNVSHSGPSARGVHAVLRQLARLADRAAALLPAQAGLPQILDKTPPIGWRQGKHQPAQTPADAVRHPQGQAGQDAEKDHHSDKILASPSYGTTCRATSTGDTPKRERLCRHSRHIC